jgi:hypothetical protein
VEKGKNLRRIGIEVTENIFKGKKYYEWGDEKKKGGRKLEKEKWNNKSGRKEVKKERWP